MKFSDAMLKGFEKVNGRVCRNSDYQEGSSLIPESVCAMGAGFLGMYGRADAACRSRRAYKIQSDVAEKFIAAWGIDIRTLNDMDDMPAEHLYGMTVAAGL